MFVPAVDAALLAVLAVELAAVAVELAELAVPLVANRSSTQLATVPKPNFVSAVWKLARAWSALAFAVPAVELAAVAVELAVLAVPFVLNRSLTQSATVLKPNLVRAVWKLFSAVVALVLAVLAVVLAVFAVPCAAEAAVLAELAVPFVANKSLSQAVMLAEPNLVNAAVKLAIAVLAFVPAVVALPSAM